jgi:hypothetical protein
MAVKHVEVADLRGTFPPTVELKFVYWVHGMDNGGEPPDVKMARIAPHVIMADRIAFEVASAESKNPAYDVPHEFSVINDILSRKGNKATIGDYYGDSVVSTIFADSWFLAQHLRDMGRTQPLQLFPVDVFAEKFEEPDTSESDFRGAAEQEAADNRHREVTVLRQLQQQANLLARDGGQRQIAIIYGAGHSLVSVAARELGAPVSRVFVDKPFKRVKSYATRELRFAGVAEQDVKLRNIERADKAVARVFYLATQLKLKGLHNNISLQGTQKLWDVGMLWARFEDRKLTTAQAYKTQQLISGISEYLINYSQPSITDKRATKNTLKQLFALASTVNRE